MDLSVYTGTTKSGSGTSLLSQTFTSAQKERVFLLMHTEAQPKEAKTLESECVTVIQHALLSTEGEAWHRLDGALKEINGMFKGFLISGAVEDVHGIVAVVEPDGTLHVSHAGRGEAYLVRRGKTSQVTEFVRGKPINAFVHIASGELEAGDTVILSSTRLLRTYTSQQLSQASARGEQS